ncbi:MAG: tetratricopeptide repeat protein [Chthoniobacteraceae bacterium]|nr:tetratricopeptide repeat protein [Chthoniobacteraceae bacterium]
MQTKARLLASVLALLASCAGAPAADNADPGADAVARAKLTRIVDAEPKNAAALIELGLLEARTQQPDAAIAHLQRATRAEPDSAAAWLALGVTACENGKLDLALAALSQAVLLEPRNAKAHNYLGVTVGRKGWKDGAEAELQRALELDDTLADAHFNLAVVYLQENPPPLELARRHYYRARELGAAPDSLVEKQLKRSKE